MTDAEAEVFCHLIQNGHLFHWSSRFRYWEKKQSGSRASETRWQLDGITKATGMVRANFAARRGGVWCAVVQVGWAGRLTTMTTEYIPFCAYSIFPYYALYLLRRFSFHMWRSLSCVSEIRYHNISITITRPHIRSRKPLRSTDTLRSLRSCSVSFGDWDSIVHAVLLFQKRSRNWHSGSVYDLV